MSNYPLPSTDPLGTDLALGTNGDLTLTMSGSLDVATDADNAAQAVRINMTTTPVTYLWGNDVGTLLAQYVDAPITQDLQNTIINAVTELVESDPRILQVEAVTIDTSVTDTLMITIQAVVSGVGPVQIPVEVGNV